MIVSHHNIIVFGWLNITISEYAHNANRDTCIVVFRETEGPRVTNFTLRAREARMPKKFASSAEGAKGVPQKYSKINKFPKSPSSRAGIPIVRFLMPMAVIKDQASALELAIRPS